MSSPHYQNDIMHCQREQCPKKEQCYRYWLGQNAVANGFTTFSVYWPSKHIVLANCRYFLDIKDY